MACFLHWYESARILSFQVVFHNKKKTALDVF